MNVGRCRIMLVLVTGCLLVAACGRDVAYRDEAHMPQAMTDSRVRVLVNEYEQDRNDMEMTIEVQNRGREPVHLSAQHGLLQGVVLAIGPQRIQGRLEESTDDQAHPERVVVEPGTSERIEVEFPYQDDVQVEMPWQVEVTVQGPEADSDTVVISPAAVG